jgi:uncharacterized protein YuzE
MTYDPSVDVAYIHLVDHIGRGEAKKTYTCDAAAVQGMINLDFDASGKLLGIEVLDAARLLPKELLAQAEPPARQKGPGLA